MKYLDYINSPIGLIELTADESVLISILFQSKQQQKSQPNHLTELAAKQLAEYFAGSRQSFEIPTAFQGTDFQNKVWHSLIAIPYGTVASYRDIAEAIDNPKAVRAVGTANGKNPLTIIVPCHRIIGSDGSLTGYAGGIERKQWLLQHEARFNS